MYTPNQIRWMYSPEAITMLFGASGAISTIMAQETKRILMNDKERRKAYVSAVNEEYNTNWKENDLEVLDSELLFCTDEILCTPGFGNVGCCGEEGVYNYDASMNFLKQYYDL